MLRRSLAVLIALLFFVPEPASAQRSVRNETRAAQSGAFYLGTAPGFAFGGKRHPRALYMDVIQGGYTLPSGLDLNLAWSGVNFFPDPGDYSLTMGRLSIGYRLMSDPLPMIQPYGFVGAGIGGDGLYMCDRPEVDPNKDPPREVCSRARWVGDAFFGGGFDFNTHLMWLGGQQLVLSAGIQARYEWVFGRYQMPVISFPIGLKLL